MLLNDWPYGFPSSTTHLIVWTRNPTATEGTSDRDFVKQCLRDNGIGSAVFRAVPLHQQLAYQGLPVAAGGACPVTERACKEVSSLPTSPYLTFET